MLKASLLSTDSDDSSLAAAPPTPELNDRYGPLFGQAVAEWWDRGGSEIYEAIPGASAAEGDDEAGSVMEE